LNIDHIVNECLLNYLNSPSSVEQSSSERNGFLASQEIPRN